MLKTIEKYAFITACLMVVGLFVFAMVVLNNHETVAKNMAPVGCTYIGTARDLNSVGFYKCGDKVEMRYLR